MSKEQFTPAERVELIKRFAGHSVCRFWIFREEKGLRITGYVANTETPLEDMRLKVNDKILPDVAWHAVPGVEDPDKDMELSKFRVFRWWPKLVTFGFSTTISIDDLAQAAEGDETAKFVVANKDGDELCDPSQAFRLPVSDLRSENSLPRPTSRMMVRVMGVDNPMEWLVSGYSNFKAFDEAVRNFSGRTLDSAENILEWGSGCGRLSRHLIKTGASVTGIDIDGEAVAWCNENLRSGAEDRVRFLKCDLAPPVSLPASHFDLCIGISVITHLDEPMGDAWLAELARLMVPGGLVLLTTHGFDTFSSVYSPEVYRRLVAGGMISRGSGHLNDVVGADYYRETWHSPDYIRSHWSRWFDVAEIVRGGLAGYQDLVIMKRKIV